MFVDYNMHKRKNEKFYARSAVACVALPYLVSLLGRKSAMYKIGTGYLLYTCMDALYDVGIYAYFFLHGPHFFRRLVELESTENFSSI